MDLHENCKEIALLFRDSLKSSLHYAAATVGEDGARRVTPIGSLILGRPGQRYYFER